MSHGSPRRWFPFFLLLAGTLALTGPYLLPGRSLMASHTDCYAPWSMKAPEEARLRAKERSNRLLTDKLFMFHPEVLHTREGLRSGTLPAWNPHVLGGLPHIATGIPAAFSPTMALSVLLPPFMAYGLGAAFHVLFAGLFLYLFLRTLCLSPWAALIGGAAFAYGGWMAVHLEYYQIAGAAAWIPMALFGLEACLSTGLKRYAVFLALGVGFSFLSGFPQISVDAIYLIAAYGLARAYILSPTLGRSGVVYRLLLCALAGVAGLLIAAPQMLPSAWFAMGGDSTRVLASIDPIRERALHPGALTAFFLPTVLGDPYLPAWMASPWNPSRTLLGESWLGDRSSFIEITFTMGILAPCLLIGMPRIWRSRKGFFFLAAALAGILVSMNTPLLDLSCHLPGLNIGDPKRFLFITALCLSVATALAVDRHLRLPREGSTSTGPALFAFGLACAVSFLAFWLGRGSHCEAFLLSQLVDRFGVSRVHAFDFIGQTRLDNAAWHLLLSLWTLAGTAFAAGCVLLASGWPKTPAPLRGVILFLFLVAELLVFAHETDKPQITDGFYRPTPLVRFLREKEEKEGLFRIIRYRDADVGPEALFPPKLPMIAGIDDAQGYVAIYLKRYRDLFDGLESGLTESVGIRSLKEEASLASPLLDLLGVRYVLCREVPEVLPSGFAVSVIDGVTLLENRAALPRAFVVQKIRNVERPEAALQAVLDPDFDPRVEAVVEGAMEALDLDRESGAPSRVKIIRRDSDRVEVTVDSAGGLLVLTENHHPGWRAEVDGVPAPIYFADYAFRGVPVPPGSHRVTFQYRSTPITIGLLLGVVGLAGLVLFLKKRAAKAPSPPRRRAGR